MKSPSVPDSSAAAADVDTRAYLKKLLRFEVFKRDSFRCQYCGKSAPEVVLEIDHVTPVANGGKSDVLNLTAM